MQVYGNDKRRLAPIADFLEEVEWYKLPQYQIRRYTHECDPGNQKDQNKLATVLCTALSLARLVWFVPSAEAAKIDSTDLICKSETFINSEQNFGTTYYIALNGFFLENQNGWSDTPCNEFYVDHEDNSYNVYSTNELTFWMFNAYNPENQTHLLIGKSIPRINPASLDCVTPDGDNFKVEEGFGCMVKVSVNQD